MQNQLFLLLLLSLLIFTCQTENKVPSKKSSPTLFDYSKFQLQSGDLLFQDGDCGSFCEAIEKVTFGVDGARFSHVGMVIPKGKNLVVIEAIGKGVVETPLDTFFNRSYDVDKNSKVVVGRLKKDYLKLIPKAIELAKTKLGKPYDDIFDIENDKYYCSELLYESFKYANDDKAIFQLFPMTYKDPETKETFSIWTTYFEKLKTKIPEGELGLNPGGMSRSAYIDIVHYYGKPTIIKI